MRQHKTKWLHERPHLDAGRFRGALCQPLECIRIDERCGIEPLSKRLESGA
jgi:hypothetical protein